MKPSCDSAKPQSCLLTLQKSQIYFRGVSEENKLKILDLVKIEEGCFPLKYLGVNLCPTKWKASDCGVILDKLNKNLNCWANKSCRDFLWRINRNRSKLHRASWKKVCLPKKLGGVRFREGKKWNKALMAKFLRTLANKQGGKFHEKKFYTLQVEETKAEYAGAV
ncbi:hypothetical protein CsatB_001506 [Cannabis sativa]